MYLKRNQEELVYRKNKVGDDYEELSREKRHCID